MSWDLWGLDYTAGRDWPAPHFHIPLDELNGYDEEMDPEDPYHAERLQGLRESGSDQILRPIDLGTRDGLATILDGAHRRHWANEMGMTHVPVRVSRPDFDLRRDGRAGQVGPALREYLRQRQAQRVAGIPNGYQVVDHSDTLPAGGGLLGLYPNSVTPNGKNWHSAIHWDDLGKITNVDTKPSFQGRGLARSLHDHVVQEYRPDLMHDRSLTPDGEAWSQAVGGQAYDPVEYQRRWDSREDSRRQKVEELRSKRRRQAQRVAMPTYYHVAPHQNRDSILEHGLDHSRGEHQWGETPGNYFWENEDDASEYADGMTQMALDDGGYSDGDEPGYVVLPFNHDGPVTDDPEGNHELAKGRSFYTTDPIPPTAFRQAQRVAMPWYHMSPQHFEPGTKLTPRGGPSPWENYYSQSGESDRQDHVWLEDDPDLADDWGHMLSESTRTHDDPYPYSIYEVKPDEDPQPQGLAHDLKQREGWFTPGATVVRQVPRQELLRRRHPDTGELLFPKETETKPRQAKANFPYIRNNGGVRKYSPEGFGQEHEPWGRYMSPDADDHRLPLQQGWERGQVGFENPLYVPHEYGDWKQNLSQEHGGLTGQELSQALMEKGHDGVVTHDEYGLGEIVDIRPKNQRGHRVQGERGWDQDKFTPVRPLIDFDDEDEAEDKFRVLPVHRQSKTVWPNNRINPDPTNPYDEEHYNPDRPRLNQMPKARDIDQPFLPHPDSDPDYQEYDPIHPATQRPWPMEQQPNTLYRGVRVDLDNPQWADHPDVQGMKKVLYGDAPEDGGMFRVPTGWGNKFPHPESPEGQQFSRHLLDFLEDTGQRQNDYRTNREGDTFTKIHDTTNPTWLGRHWTDDRDIAEDFAHPHVVGREDEKSSPRGFSVMLESDWDGRGEDLDQSNSGGSWGDEREVNLSPGAPVGVKGLHIRHHDDWDGHDWHNVLSEPQGRTAASIAEDDPLWALLDSPPGGTKPFVPPPPAPPKPKPKSDPIAGVPEGWEDYYRQLDEQPDRADAAHLMMPTELVNHYREYDRDPNDQNYQTVKKIIQDHGKIRQPLIISTNDTHGLLTEGNHRAQIAQELGITHLPVKVYRDNDVQVNEGTPVEHHPDFVPWLDTNRDRLPSFWGADRP